MALLTESSILSGLPFAEEGKGKGKGEADKRKEQNRAAQRAFRERKEKHVKEVSRPSVADSNSSRIPT